MANKKEQEYSPLCVYLGENKEWRITADSFQFILARKINSKDGKRPTSYSVEGYFTRLDNLLETLYYKKLRATEIKTLKGVEKQMKLLREEISKYAMVVITGRRSSQ